MNVVKRAAILFLMALPGLAAEPQWRHMQTENFQIYSLANEREMRSTLQYFERVRSFFVTANGKAPENEVPTYIIMFNSEKEYAPYRIDEFSIAYYAGGAERDYVVMGKTGEQTANVATSGYVHLLVGHLGLQWPEWMKYGQAMLYSTLHVQGNNTLYGDIIPGRLQALRRDRWVPLATILSAERDSVYFSEKDLMSSFQNESWILVHMLATDPGYVAGFDEVQRLVGNGTEGAAALEQVYKKPLERIESELKTYVRAQQFRHVVVPVGTETAKLKDPAQPADAFDVRLALADLLSQPAQLAERKSRLEALASEFPQRAEAQASLGYVAWRMNDLPKAAEYLAKAYDLGARSSKLLWDLGRVGQGSQPEKARAALEELLKREPRNNEARLELAVMYARAEIWGQSLVTSRGITNVTSALAPRLFSVKGQAEIQLGLREEARKSATELQKYAKTDNDRATAQRMIEFLDRAAAQEAARLTAPAPRSAPAEPARVQEPVLVARPAAPQSEEEIRRAILHDANGKFVELACTGDTAALILETTGGRKRFHVLEPNRIIVTGSAEGFASLECGAQKNAPTLRIQFTEAPPEIAADGLLRAVHFPQ